jgi:soluble lytic murein transglycosylase-like protein
MRLVPVLLLALAPLVPATAAAQVFACPDEHGGMRLSRVEAEGCSLYLKAGDEGALKGVRARLRLPWAEEEARLREAAAQERLEQTLAALPFGQMVRDAASRYSVDPALVHAVIFAESAYNPQAVSDKGAIGLMQVMPDTGARYGVKEQDLRNPARNLQAGTRYLADLLELFGGDVELALAGYNAGEGAVLKFGRRIPPFAETRAYVPRVLERWRQLRAVRM